jgi:uncharacterized protein with GYD domain
MARCCLADATPSARPAFFRLNEDLLPTVQSRTQMIRRPDAGNKTGHRTRRAFSFGVSIRERNATKGRKTMAIYIMLASFTDQGIRKVSDSPKRTDAFKEMAKKCGATVRDSFWTLGEYDMVAIVEAPDDISITALGLSSGALGNVRTQTLRAFTQADMKTIVGKMVKG